MTQRSSLTNHKVTLALRRQYTVLSCECTIALLKALNNLTKCFFKQLNKNQTLLCDQTNLQSS